MSEQMKEKSIDIIALEFPENVRTRPGMFIGATDAPDVILREAVDNSVDELMGSIKCNKLDVQIKPGQIGDWYVVSDNGRGIPIILDEEKGITKTEMAVGSLNAGSKFKKGTDDISTGLNGVGVSCTNALSSDFVILSVITEDNFNKSIPDVEVYWNQAREEGYYYLYYRKGIKIEEGAIPYSQIEKKWGFQFPVGMSTITAFIPDPEIWTDIVATYSKKSLSYVQVILEKFYQKTCEITIDGKKVDNVFKPYQLEFTKDIEVKSKDRVKFARFYVNLELDKDLSTFETSGSINSLIVNRGLHIDWMARCYKDTLKSFFNLMHDYTWCGLKINVICLTSNADFSSQTKERCVKIDNIYYDDIQWELQKEFKNLFKNNLQYFEDHVARLNEYADSLNKISAINKVKELVGTVDGGNRTRSKIPSSVKDAASNDRSLCELFIVEGKSASGTMLKCRDPRYHAILELRGMVFNGINADLDTFMNNAEMNSIIVAIGAGVNEYFNIDNCRYGKIILAADSDIDGEKINSMLLGMIAKKMTFLLEEGRVFIALAPLYHQGDTYVYPGEDPATKIDMTKPFKRYKGIGEVNVSEAKDFYFDPNRRKLIQVSPNNLSYVFDLLTSPYFRKELMVQKEVVIDKYNTGIL